ncbi:MAG TPA: alpha/beta hydrolase [Candidatus Koribacter sp.]
MGTIAVQDRWVETPGGRLFARSWEVARADSGPIILFHDSLGCVELWRSFPAVLAERTSRRVIAYDRLGFGRSDARRDRLRVNFIREEAETFFPALRAQLGFDHFVAFGHSVGGAMAIHCAALSPDACEALITESAQSFVEDRTGAGILEAKALFQDPDQFARLERYHGEKARWVLDAWTETWLSPEFANWSLVDILPKVQCPTLAIHGSEDEFGSRQHPEKIAQLVSAHAEVEILEGAGHVPHREREEWIAERVATFLTNARGATY